MTHKLTKDEIVNSLLTAFKEIQESFGAEDEVVISSRPAEDFVYIDSEILMQVTGSISGELQIEISAKCQLFLDDAGQPITIEEVANKLLELNLNNGAR